MIDFNLVSFDPPIINNKQKKQKGMRRKEKVRAIQVNIQQHRLAFACRCSRLLATCACLRQLLTLLLVVPCFGR